MHISKMGITRRRFLSLLGKTLAVTGLTTLGTYQYALRIEPEWLSIERLSIPLPRLKSSFKGFKIVQLSDFHYYPNTSLTFIQEVVEITNSLKPDLIVLTGDYIDNDVEPIFDLMPVLAQLNAKYGVFAVLGNHDRAANVVKTALLEAGFPVLINTGVNLTVGTAHLYLAGLDDGFNGQPDLQAALANRPQNAPTLLLAHEPDLADKVAKDGRVSLQLSGHSHGGQVRIPGIGAPVLPPLGRKYDQGLYQVNGMWLYTTLGIGVIGAPFGPPVRFNCPPEITEITLI